MSSDIIVPTMIHDNAFLLLEISPHASRDEIDNAREDASFDNRAPDSVLQNAVNALSAPMTRLREEISYLWGIAPSSVKHVAHLAQTSDNWDDVSKVAISTDTPGLTKAHIASYFCGQSNAKQIDDTHLANALVTLINAQQEIDTEYAADMFRDARKKSHFKPVDINKESFIEGLKKVRDEIHMKSALHALLAMEHPGQLAAMFASELQFDKTATGRFLADLLRGPYKTAILPWLHPLEKKIEKASSVLRKNPKDESALTQIEESLTEWDEYVQPIQIIDEGRKLDEKRSENLMLQLRDLGMHLHENSASEEALRLTQLLSRIFHELPNASETLEQDIITLKEIMNARAATKRMISDIYRHLENMGKAESDFIANKHANQVVAALSKFLDNTDISKEHVGIILMDVRGHAVEMHNKKNFTHVTLNLATHLSSLANKHDAPQEIISQLEEETSSLQDLRNMETARLLQICSRHQEDVRSPQDALSQKNERLLQGIRRLTDERLSQNPHRDTPKKKSLFDAFIEHVGPIIIQIFSVIIGWTFIALIIIAIGYLVDENW